MFVWSCVRRIIFPRRFSFIAIAPLPLHHHHFHCTITIACTIIIAPSPIIICITITLKKHDNHSFQDWWPRETQVKTMQCSPLAPVLGRNPILFLLRKQFKGITSIPSFAAAINQSFANQQLQTTAILTIDDDNPYGQYQPVPVLFKSYWCWFSERDYEQCPTCALIAEGSSMSYSDNTCPQVSLIISKLVWIRKEHC